MRVTGASGAALYHFLVWYLSKSSWPGQRQYGQNKTGLAVSMKFDGISVGIFLFSFHLGSLEEWSIGNPQRPNLVQKLMLRQAEITHRD